MRAACPARLEHRRGVGRGPAKHSTMSTDLGHVRPGLFHGTPEAQLVKGADRGGGCAHRLVNPESAFFTSPSSGSFNFK